MLEVGWPDPAEVLDRMESTRSCWASSAARARSTSVIGANSTAVLGMLPCCWVVLISASLRVVSGMTLRFPAAAFRQGHPWRLTLACTVPGPARIRAGTRLQALPVPFMAVTLRSRRWRSYGGAGSHDSGTSQGMAVGPGLIGS